MDVLFAWYSQRYRYWCIWNCSINNDHFKLVWSETWSCDKYALSFSALAGAVFSPLFSSFITSFGWQNAYFIQAASLLAVTLPALVVRWTVQPKDSNLLPYGNEEKNHNQIRINRSGFNFMTVSFVCMCIFWILHTSITGISQHLSGFATSIGLSAASI